MNTFSKIIAIAMAATLGGCASLDKAINPTIWTGKFAFEGNVYVSYEVNQQYYLDRQERDCIISLTLHNNSASAQKPLFTLYLVKGGATLGERSVYFPTAFAGGTSFATITLQNIEMGFDVCKGLTTGMKAKLQGVSN